MVQAVQFKSSRVFQIAGLRGFLSALNTLINSPLGAQS